MGSKTELAKALAPVDRPLGQISNGLVNSLDDAIKLGQIVAESKMFPDVQTQARAVIAILAGRELGVDPIASIRGINFIKGRPEISAGLFAALIEASPVYSYEILETTDEICRLRWYKNRITKGESSFTIQEAQRAGLIKPDSNWVKYPKAMLFNRAISAGQKLYAADLGIGALYVQGEISEAENAMTIDITPTAPPSITIDAALDPVSERIGEMIRIAGMEDSSGERRFIFDWLRQGAWQAIAERLKVSHVPDLISEFGHLATTPATFAPAPPPIEKIEQAPAEAGQDNQNQVTTPATDPAPASDPVPLKNTAQGLRAQCIDLASAILKKYKTTLERADVIKQVIQIVGKPIDKFADIPEAQLLDVHDKLEQWDRELLEKAGLGANEPNGPQFS